MKGIGVRGIEIHQPGHFLRMPRSDGAQLLSCNRVACQNRAIEFQRIDYCSDVIAQPICRIARRGRTRRAESTSCDSVNVIFADELGGEFIEYVRRVSQTRQKNQRLSGTTPIEDFELDILIDGYDLRLMWRRI